MLTEVYRKDVQSLCPPRSCTHTVEEGAAFAKGAPSQGRMARRFVSRMEEAVRVGCRTQSEPHVVFKTMVDSPSLASSSFMMKWFSLSTVASIFCRNIACFSASLCLRFSTRLGDSFAYHPSDASTFRSSLLLYACPSYVPWHQLTISG